MNDLLRIEHLSKRYPGFELSGVNITVSPGSVVGFIGSNGAGKTTTIKAALGLIKTNGGQVSILGAPPEDAKARQRIGVVFDSNAFPDNITVADAGLIMRGAYTEWQDATFASFIERFELNPKQKVKELSRGMGMKLSLAGALSHNAELLILDEPTAGLDPLARDEALEYLREFMAEEGHGILMSSHITSDLEKIADYIVCIDHGRIIFSVEKDTITDQAGLAQCRSAEFETLCTSGFFAPGKLRFIRNTYGTTVLIPDRKAFAENFNSIAVDRLSIDDYMALMLKGETK